MKIKSAIFKKGIRGTNNILYDVSPQIAFAGRSNVGKSSLMNCLLGTKDLVRSGKMPGKTREINFFLVNEDRYFVDLPGYGYAKLPIKMREQIAKMIQWYFLESVPNRKTVIVVDIKVGPNEMDTEISKIIKNQGEEFLIAANKADTLNQRDRSIGLKKISNVFPGIRVISCSAKTKEGKEELLDWIFS